MTAAPLPRFLDYPSLLTDPNAIQAAVRAKPNVHPIAAAAAAAHAAAVAAKAAAGPTRSDGSGAQPSASSNPSQLPISNGRKKRTNAELQMDINRPPTSSEAATAKPGRSSKPAAAAKPRRGAKTPRASSPGPTSTSGSRPMGPMAPASSFPGASGLPGFYRGPDGVAGALPHWHATSAAATGPMGRRQGNVPAGCTPPTGQAPWPIWAPNSSSCPGPNGPRPTGYHRVAEPAASQAALRGPLPAAGPPAGTSLPSQLPQEPRPAVLPPMPPPAASLPPLPPPAAAGGSSAEAAGMTPSAADAEPAEDMDAMWRRLVVSQHLGSLSGLDIQQHLDDPVMMELYRKELPIAQALRANAPTGSGHSPTARSPTSSNSGAAAATALERGASMGDPDLLATSAAADLLQASDLDQNVEHQLDEDWLLHLTADDDEQVGGAQLDLLQQQAPQQQPAQQVGLQLRQAAAAGAAAAAADLGHAASRNLDSLPPASAAGDSAGSPQVDGGSPTAHAAAGGLSGSPQLQLESEGGGCPQGLLKQGSTISCDMTAAEVTAGMGQVRSPGATTAGLAPGTPTQQVTEHPSSPSATMRSGNGQVVVPDGGAPQDQLEVTSAGGRQGVVSQQRASVAGGGGSVQQLGSMGPPNPRPALSPKQAAGAAAGIGQMSWPPAAAADAPRRSVGAPTQPLLQQDAQTPNMHVPQSHGQQQWWQAPQQAAAEASAAANGSGPPVPASMVPALVNILKQPALRGANPLAAAIVAAALGGPAAVAAAVAGSSLAAGLQGPAAAAAAALASQLVGSSVTGASPMKHVPCDCVYCVKATQERVCGQVQPGLNFPVTAGLQNPALTHMVFSAALAGSLAAPTQGPRQGSVPPGSSRGISGSGMGGGGGAGGGDEMMLGNFQAASRVSRGSWAGPAPPPAAALGSQASWPPLKGVPGTPAAAGRGGAGAQGGALGSCDGQKAINRPSTGPAAPAAMPAWAVSAGGPSWPASLHLQQQQLQQLPAGLQYMSEGCY